VRKGQEVQAVSVSVKLLIRYGIAACIAVRKHEQFCVADFQYFAWSFHAVGVANVHRASRHGIDGRAGVAPTCPARAGCRLGLPCSLVFSRQPPYRILIKTLHHGVIHHFGCVAGREEHHAALADFLPPTRDQLAYSVISQHDP
jgi:hypothetical protein